MSKTLTVMNMIGLALLLVLTLALGAGLALADRSDNAETGFESPTVGVHPESGDGISAGETQSQFNATALNAEGQPDGPRVNVAGAQGVSNTPQAQHYLRAAGSNFRPRDSSAAFSYFGGGCMIRSAGSGDSWFTLDLQLPDGAVIDGLRLYYYDTTSTYDITSELWAFDGAGGTDLIAEAIGSRSTGYGSAGSDPFSYTVNNQDASLVIVASLPGGVGSSLALCGIEISYQYSPLSQNFQPATMYQAMP